MIIQTDKRTPQPIDIKEVVRAAYLGVPPSELAKRLGVNRYALYRWLALHFPRYAQVAQGTRIVKNQLTKWQQIIEKYPFNKIPEGMQFYIGMTFPPYVWADDFSLYDYQWLGRFRRTLYVDRKLLQIYLRRVQGKPLLTDRLMRKVANTSNIKVLDLIFGLIEPGSREEQVARRAYGIVLVEKGGIKSEKPVEITQELRRVWLSSVHGKRWIDRVVRNQRQICGEGPDAWGLHLVYDGNQRRRGRYWEYRQFGSDKGPWRERKDRRRGGLHRRT